MQDITPIIASATVGSTPSRINEDAAFSLVHNDGYHVAVADGVGSASHGKEASNFVIAQLECLLKEAEAPKDISKHYQTIQKNLNEIQESSGDGEYETTLISLHHTLKNKFEFNYAGNGCIFHFKGNFWQQKTPSHLPFNLVNYLSPHTVLENGKEVLFNYFSNKNEIELLPSEISISADPYFGDIFIIGTDGFYSEDQKKVGKNKSGIWQQVSQLLSTFFDELSKIFVENKQLSEEMISNFLEGFLNEMKNQLQLEDDTSIGVLISDIALKYHRKQTIMD